MDPLRISPSPPRNPQVHSKPAGGEAAGKPFPSSVQPGGSRAPASRAKGLAPRTALQLAQKPSGEITQPPTFEQVQAIQKKIRRSLDPQAVAGFERLPAEGLQRQADELLAEADQAFDILFALKLNNESKVNHAKVLIRLKEEVRELTTRLVLAKVQKYSNMEGKNLEVLLDKFNQYRVQITRGETPDDSPASILELSNSAYQGMSRSIADARGKVADWKKLEPYERPARLQAQIMHLQPNIMAYAGMSNAFSFQNFRLLPRGAQLHMPGESQDRLRSIQDALTEFNGALNREGVNLPDAVALQMLADVQAKLQSLHYDLAEATVGIKNALEAEPPGSVPAAQAPTTGSPQPPPSTAPANGGAVLTLPTSLQDQGAIKAFLDQYRATFTVLEEVAAEYEESLLRNLANSASAKATASTGNRSTAASPAGKKKGKGKMPASHASSSSAHTPAAKPAPKQGTVIAVPNESGAFSFATVQHDGTATTQDGKVYEPYHDSYLLKDAEAAAETEAERAPDAEATNTKRWQAHADKLLGKTTLEDYRKAEEGLGKKLAGYNAPGQLLPVEVHVNTWSRTAGRMSALATKLAHAGDETKAGELTARAAEIVRALMPWKDPDRLKALQFDAVMARADKPSISDWLHLIQLGLAYVQPPQLRPEGDDKTLAMIKISTTPKVAKGDRGPELHIHYTGSLDTQNFKVNAAHLKNAEQSRFGKQKQLAQQAAGTAVEDIYRCRVFQPSTLQALWAAAVKDRSTAA